MSVEDVERCPTCGETITGPGAPCEACARRGLADHVVSPSTGQFAMTGRVPTLVSELNDTILIREDEKVGIDGLYASGAKSLLVTSGAGRSEATLTPDGTLSARVLGGDPGRAGEPEVAHQLIAALTEAGRAAMLVPGAIDRRGEDVLVDLDGRRLTLQIVSVPDVSLAPRFWKEAKARGVEGAWSRPQLVEWLRRAIEDKKGVMAPRNRAETLLAIDVRWVSLAAQSVDDYLCQYSSPEDEFGFAEVWAVGHLSKYVRRLR